MYLSSNINLFSLNQVHVKSVMNTVRTGESIDDDLALCLIFNVCAGGAGLSTMHLGTARAS